MKIYNNAYLVIKDGAKINYVAGQDDSVGLFWGCADLIALRTYLVKKNTKDALKKVIFSFHFILRDI